MKPLFEAKAIINARTAFYNIYRVELQKYKAKIIVKENQSHTVPDELVLEKENGMWKTGNNDYKELGTTLGVEIDVFNNGYGDLLGKIGVR